MNLAEEMKKRNMTEEHLLEYMKFEDECIQKGFTFDSLLKAREKEIPFKPVTFKLYAGKCKCGAVFLDNLTQYCGNCGQRLDWSDDE